MSEFDAGVLGAAVPQFRIAAARLRQDPLSLVLWSIIGTAAIALFGALCLTDFSISGFGWAALGFALPVGVGLVFRRFGWVRASILAESLAQFVLAGLLSGLLVLILASTNLPYRDAELAAIDRMLLPIDWLTISTALTANKTAAFFLNLAYIFIPFLPLVLIFTLALAGQLQRLRVFVLAWAVCLVFVILIFPLVPAMGYYLHSGVPENEMAGVFVNIGWSHIKVLQPLRDGLVRDLQVASYSGIVTFPSFHASAAILMAWGFYGMPALRWSGLLWNGLMLVSAMPIGAHYLIDILVGVLLAVVSLGIAQRIAARCAAADTGPAAGCAS